MAISQIINALNGYYDRENERVKATHTISWETTRWGVMWNFNVHAVKKKDRIWDVRKFIKLPWDKKEAKLTPEEFEEVNKRFPDKQRNGI